MKIEYDVHYHDNSAQFRFYDRSIITTRHDVERRGWLGTGDTVCQDVQPSVR